MNNIDIFIAGRIRSSYSAFTDITEPELKKEFDDSDNVSAVSGAVTYVVKYMPEYIYYQWKDTGSLNMTERSGMGSVVIGMAVPKEVMFNVSPYEVMRFVRGFFFRKYTKGSEFVSGNWLYDHSILTADVKTLIAVFSEKTKERKGTFEPMNEGGAIGKVKVPKDKLAQFFANPLQCLSSPSDFKNHSYFNISSDCEETDDFVKVKFDESPASFSFENPPSGTNDNSAMVSKNSYDTLKEKYDILNKSNSSLLAEKSKLQSDINIANKKIEDNEKQIEDLNNEKKKAEEEGKKAEQNKRFKSLFWVAASLFAACLAGVIAMFAQWPEKSKETYKGGCYEQFISFFHDNFNKKVKEITKDLKERHGSIDDTLQAMGFVPNSEDFNLAKFFLEEYPTYPKYVEVHVQDTLDSVWLEQPKPFKEKPFWTDLVWKKMEFDQQRKAEEDKLLKKYANIESEADFFKALKDDQSISPRIENTDYYKKYKSYLDIAVLNNQYDFSDYEKLRTEMTAIADKFITAYVNRNPRPTWEQFYKNVPKEYRNIPIPINGDNVTDYAVQEILKPRTPEENANILFSKKIDLVKLQYKNVKHIRTVCSIITH